MTDHTLDCYSDLDWRGLVSDATDPDRIRAMLAPGQLTTAYCGFDPTADSLHVGSLVPILALARLQRAGHRPIAVAGGATGLIGDPSGKSKERNLLDRDQLDANVLGIKAQLSRFLDFDRRPNGALLVDNHDWLGPFSLLDFLRDTGKHFTVNYMLAKDSVKTRIGERETGNAGISFTEFSYMLLQAQDFLHLFESEGCALQIGGSDQWGNITAGIELIRRTVGGEAFGLTFPLVTTASGQKFGKTEHGTVWLSAERTSPFAFYQFFVRTDDRDVERYLKYFTFLGRDELTALAALVTEQPERREAQKRLAREVTTLVHGEEATRSAEAGTNLLYGGSVDAIAEADLLAATADLPHAEVPEPFGESRGAVELFALSGLCSSNGDARRALEQGALYVNNTRLPGERDARVSAERLLFGRYLLLRKGKRDYFLYRFEVGA